MLDFEKARVQMVDCQIRTCDVTDHDVLRAIMQVPREEFAPKHMKQLAYIDEDIQIANDRYMMEPAPFAKLLQLAKIGEDDVVLVIGAGCGYCAAAISVIASSVVGIEEDADLASQAATRLSELGFDNAVIITSEHAKGFEKEGPYDAIFINGAIEVLPEELLQQLAEGGRLVAVEGVGNSAVAKLYGKSNGHVSDRVVSNCSIKPLPGFKKDEEFQF